jgi:hypothetical protein
MSDFQTELATVLSLISDHEIIRTIGHGPTGFPTLEEALDATQQTYAQASQHAYNFLRAHAGEIAAMGRGSRAKGGEAELVWTHDGPREIFATLNVGHIKVFESIDRPNLWTWHAEGAHGRDFQYFPTAAEAIADCERWWAALSAAPGDGA